MRWLDGFNGYEFEQALEDGEGQGSLGYYDPWGCKESDTTERLNNNKKEQRKGLRTYLKCKFLAPLPETLRSRT